MVRLQLAGRGMKEGPVLEAMRKVPREAFVAPAMVEFAYEDAPLPIGEGQTISQPYIVAIMAEALEIEPDDRVLDIGTGSGYAAAVLAHLAAEVFTVERHRALAEAAERRFRELGLDNIHVRVGDGSLGWKDHAPYDAIQVAASGPDIPPELIEQLAPGGRLVIPTGPAPRLQNLLRLRRTDGDVVRENLGAVRFVPLIGTRGWAPKDDDEVAAPTEAPSLPDRIRRGAEAFDDIDTASLDSLLERIGDARVVMLGEASHGTSEFYRMRTAITRALVDRRGFRILAVEADWPDAAHLDSHIRGRAAPPSTHRPFARFPTWMWPNHEVGELVEALRDWNEKRDPEDQVGFYGLDLYSLFSSLEVVLDYLDGVDPDAARIARQRYGCLQPWESDPSAYGHAVLTGRYRECADDAVKTLQSLLERRLTYERREDGRRFFDAEQNARLVANAERYYRIMYSGGRESWNLRDQHMFDTLEALLAHHGPEAKAVVWAHNSHLGDARATEMAARGEHNLGQLCRERFGDEAYGIGFGTHAGTVAAAHQWGGDMEIMEVRPSHPRSYERLCHDSEIDRFLLPLRHADAGLRRDLTPERLQRAIGVIYRPTTELQSHYFHASLPRQFDEWIWFDETEAVTPVPVPHAEDDMPDTFPFGV